MSCFRTRFATHLFGSEGHRGRWRDDGGQPAPQLDDHSPGLRWSPILCGRRGTTPEIMDPWAQGSPKDGNDGEDPNTSNSDDTRGKWHSPYHTLKQWGEYLIPGGYPDSISPSDIQLLTPGTHEISALLVLIRGGCREADVGCDALKVCLLKTKVEPKRRDRNVLMRCPGRLEMFVVRVNLTDVRGCHVFACWRGVRNRR